MFRAIVKQRSNLDLLPIADMQILNASISEDTTQKATSTINVVEVPSNVFLGDLVGIYTSKGVFIYWGTISAINENKITLQQFNSFYNDNHLLVPQTSNNQKTFFNTKTISNVIELYLKSKELGHQSTLNDMSASLVPTYQGLADKDVANNYKGITHTIIDNEQTFAPYPQEKESKNLETFLYDMFNTYNRIIRPIINLKGGGGTPQKDYYELEYIQCNGNQHIDIGIPANQTNKAILDFEFTELGNQALYGVQSNVFFGLASNNDFEANGGGYGSYSRSYQQRYEFDYRYQSGNTKLFIDGVERITLTNIFDVSTNNVWLFGRNPQTIVRAKGKLYSCQIYNSDILVRDFIPCIRKTDMAIGLWDKVNNEFYGNQGSGVFQGGGIVE